MGSVQLATLWNSTVPAAPSGRQNWKPKTDSLTPIADSTWHGPNIGGVTAQSGASYTMGQADQGNSVTFTNASAVAVAISPTSMDAGWIAYAYFIGAGGGTLTPSSGTINGAASLTLNQFQWAQIRWDGTNWTALISGSGSLVLKTNGVSNSVQNLFNAVAGSNVTISETAGSVVFAASISGTSGSIFVNPNSFGTSRTNWQNLTVMARFTGFSLLQQPAAWTVKMWFTAGSPAIGNMVVFKTALGGGTSVLSTTAVTIGGISNPTLTTPTFVTTDTVSLALDINHDWVFAIFFTNVAGNASVSVNGNGIAGPLSQFASGDQTGVSTIPALGGVNANYLVIGAFLP